MATSSIPAVYVPEMVVLDCRGKAEAGNGFAGKGLAVQELQFSCPDALKEPEEVTHICNYSAGGRWVRGGGR